MKAAGLEKTIARKNLLPSLSLTGGPGSRSQEFNDLLDQQFQIWNVTGNLMQPIFQGGRLRANVRRTEAVRLAAMDSYKAAALNAFREVETTLAAESLLKEEEILLKEAAKAALTAADLSWERYQRGLEGIFATLESRRRAFEAESRLLSLRRERLLNRIDLHLALGDEALPHHP
jgi:outer membrane protein TolC